MLKNVVAVAAAFLIFQDATAAVVNPITPVTGTLGISRWESNQNKTSYWFDASGAVSTNFLDLVDATAALSTLYKQNVGENSDSGLLGSSYTTSFSNSANDPEDALIDYLSGPSASPLAYGEVYLFVKDGKNTPSVYIFDLFALNWNGKDDLNLQDSGPAMVRFRLSLSLAEVSHPRKGR